MKNKCPKSEQMKKNLKEMKRKRKDECPSPLLDESPKRTKVHAQRKFAQGSAVSSPVITPVKELESQDVDTMPEPVELLPMKRPNTEDFLTFLCFRGTPILPPNLNFFNTASIVDNNGQVHEIKSESSPKNGPIDTCTLSKSSGSSEKPFVAFGVRKRADPIVISRQMDKKRRHALALQALRRKYQEQKMAKIRAVTISKLSEKVTNRTIVKTTPPVPTPIPIKKIPITNTNGEKPSLEKAKVVSTKHVKVTTTRTVKTSLGAQVKQKMCLRSFRGRFVQRELQFRHVKKSVKSDSKKDNNSDDSEEENSSNETPKPNTNVVLPKVTRNITKGQIKTDIRVTRSNQFLNNKITSRRQQIKQRMILSTPSKPIVKPRTLRSHNKVDQERKNFKTVIETTKKINTRKEVTTTKTTEINNKVSNIKKEFKVELKKSVVKKGSPDKKGLIKEEEIKVKNENDVKSKGKDEKIKKENREKEIETTGKQVKNEIKSKEQSKTETKPKKEPAMLKKQENKDNKKENSPKKEETPKKKVKNEEQKTNQRPSRKTKEAAAIYMEILSHKLVNESKIDDDNISIDSFPELPNVKRTEQRENELKAKAKSGSFTDKKKQNSEIEGIAKEAKKKFTEDDNAEEDSPLKKSSEEKNKKTKKQEERRQTRYSLQNMKKTESDSDESFHMDIKIPRKKQITRSKLVKTSKDTESEKGEIYKDFSSSNSISISGFSDPTTSSEISTKDVTSTKNKKYTKMKNKKNEGSFSDSDEEPLSKLTQKNDVQQKKSQVLRSGKKVSSPINTESSKPKRECAKRPQNYLPMFSSSSDEDMFYGFDKSESKHSHTEKSKCNAIVIQSDLSCKDLGRRFGKGKVNMSNEQIEKWLKESALAGSTIKNDDEETNEMIKYTEKIPTVSSLNYPMDIIDINQLKNVLLIEGDKKDEIKVEKDEEKPMKITPSKPTMTIDRKIIFKKDKISPNVLNSNAFSVSNESSVYAFGEDEDLARTPFRRPSRRPSSTATSKSEDELTKIEDTKGQFRKPPPKNEPQPSEDPDDSFGIPLPKTITKTTKKQADTALMVPPSIQKPKFNQDSKKLATRNIEKASESLEYKIPSSPSASSSSSSKLYKKQNQKIKNTSDLVTPINLDEFPLNGKSLLVEAPIFYPNEKEFQDPLEFIEKIRSKAEQFGICKIVPPSIFKPECKVSDDMRFTAYNQYVHKLLHRWGPNFKEFMAIKKYLSTQNINLIHPPWIGGMEIDLPRLYQTVQSLGGLKEVIEKKKWCKVSDLMKIPKSAQDRVTKLDDIYCKYLLPYDTLSPNEREKLFDQVENDWAKRESKSFLNAQQQQQQPEIQPDLDQDQDDSSTDDEAEECIIKGRNMALNAFYRIARNTMSMWFKTNEPNPEEVEEEFWKHVITKKYHICVHSGSIDSGNWGYGFAVTKNSPFARHSWNLKVLTNNSGSVLRSLGPIMGVTVPTLHVGMVFSACCWYRDPHSLPWIEYLHTGGSKIWYGIPDSSSELFHGALKKLVPSYCRNKTLWLPSDTAMVPPNILIENGVSLSRIVQEPGQFIVVFPKAFTSSLSTGYVVSESVYFAPLYWLKNARDVFDELRESCEPSMFSLERLFLSIANDSRSNVEVLKQILPSIEEICNRERKNRIKLKELGIEKYEKLHLPDNNNKKKKKQQDDGDYECEICRMNLFISMIFDSEDEGIYCLEHAIEELNNKKIQSKNCKMMYTYDDSELIVLKDKILKVIDCKLQKKHLSKYTGMPTLLK